MKRLEQGAQPTDTVRRILERAEVLKPAYVGATAGATKE